MKLTKRFFRRWGDQASSRGSHEVFDLFDGTKLYVNVELVFTPNSRQHPKYNHKKVSWYASIVTHDKSGKYANAWHASPDNSFVKPFIGLGIAQKNLLAGLPHRQRKQILESWLKKALTKAQSLA